VKCPKDKWSSEEDDGIPSGWISCPIYSPSSLHSTVSTSSVLPPLEESQYRIIAKFVEVKGPRDSLSDRQVVMIDIHSDLAFDNVLCYQFKC
jgi:hypothetical protein